MITRTVPIMLLFLSNLGMAQTAPSVLDLPAVLDWAEIHNTDVQNAQLEVQLAQKRVKEVVAAGLPQVEGSATYQNFLSLPTSLLPAEFFGGMQGDFIPLKFGTSQNMTAGVSASQLIFSGSYIVGLQAAGTYVDLAKQQQELASRDVRLQATQAYYAVMVSDEAIAIMKASLELIERIFTKTEAMYAQGFVEKIDVDRMRIARDNIRVRLNGSRRDAQIARQMLKLAMNWPLTDTIVLADSLESLASVSSELLIQPPNPSNRVETAVLDIQHDLTKLNIRNQKSGYLPTLSAFFSYEQNAQRNTFNFFDGNELWFESSILGVQLQLPIFDGLAKSARIQQQKIQLNMIENSREQWQDVVTFEVSQSRSNYLKALDDFQTQKANLELAHNIFDVAVTKYKEGIGSSVEVTSAEETLLNTQTSYIQTLYQLALTRANLQKALGLI